MFDLERCSLLLISSIFLTSSFGKLTLIFVFAGRLACDLTIVFLLKCRGFIDDYSVIANNIFHKMIDYELGRR